MGFTAPWLLVGLSLAALPILLHLVQRREPPERAFPAVRYLEDATREHRRRLQLRHLLLLLMRTLAIVALVLAAAGMTLHRAVPFGTHPPSAMVVVFDNSASSAAVQEGEPVLASLRRAADLALSRATAADRLWLLPADGVVRPGTADELRAALATLEVDPRGMALGDAVSVARDLLAATDRPGEVVVVTDAQRSAIGTARGEGALVVLRPRVAAPSNRGVQALDAGPQPWGRDGGQLAVTVTAADTTPVAATLRAAERSLREVLLTPGTPATLRVPSPESGWTELMVALAPDEFRLDDTARVAVRVAPPTPVTWTAGDRWLDAALAVLVEDGRVQPGTGVRLGALGPGPSVVMPPEDPALIPALNRSLAGRDIAWRYGEVIVAAERLDSGQVMPFRTAVSRRMALVPTQVGATDTLITVGGAPWAVRDQDVILLASRLAPEWTDLPVSAAFVPLLDLLLTRAVRGEPPMPVIAVGEATSLPGRATAIASAGVATPVEGGGMWRAPSPGVHFILAGTDTLGAVTATIAAAESDLVRADDDAIRDQWPGAVIRSVEDAEGAVLGAAGRGDLRPLLLVLGLGCVIGESLLAGRGKRAPR